MNIIMASAFARVPLHLTHANTTHVRIRVVRVIARQPNQAQAIHGPWEVVAPWGSLFLSAFAGLL